ncbi:ATP-dependent DNA helicase [Pseudonocardia sp. TMWB2A]|uniref:ATP-dependent DNA helicase n=1 Tax=Pseudonocardia sp. TMWB2A TaxID=687430 RepID=UPI00307EA1AB
MSVPALNFPALHASHAGIWIATPDGTVREVGKGEAIARAAETPMILLNAPLTGQRLGYADLSGLDLLELFAFVHPAKFAVPTPAGLARALGLWMGDKGAVHVSPSPSGVTDRSGSQPDLNSPGDYLSVTGLGWGLSEITDAPKDNRPSPNPSRKREGDFPLLYLAATQKLVATLADPAWAEREGAWTAAQSLARLRWPWGQIVAQAIKRPEQAERWLFSRLPEWEEMPPRAAPKPVIIGEDAAVEHLHHLTGDDAELRPGQQLYTRAAAHAFRPRERRDAPNMLLAEAGTGIGKTLGYLAPAALWSRQSGGAVWVSTYTKALQRQLARETERLYLNPAQHRDKVVVRKGRENYLCLLNLEDALQGGFAGRAAVLAQLVARWAAYSRDGDMIGGDLPGWLPTLFRRNGSTALTDRRGECIYAGCPHYRKCFIERAARGSAHADIVIANHALLMVVAARARDYGDKPARIIFDEGHHLFDAADSMFAVALTGQEAIEIRRWVLGPEGNARGRRRGLAARLSDVASYDEAGAQAIIAASTAAQALPSDGWLQRLGEGDPFGPVERLLAAVRGTVYARDDQGDAGYGLETEMAELDATLVEAAGPAAQAIDALLRPLVALGKRLEAVMEEAPDWLDAAARARVEGAIGSLSLRCETLGAWLALLSRVGGPAMPDFVDWLAVDRIEGREWDMGIHRHWLDPTKPVAETVLKPAHGVVMTSATLRSGGDWAVAEARTGAVHLESPVEKIGVDSPFDYARQSEVLIVTDVKKGDLPQLAGAYARLIEAAQGGTLGLFTAIRRLRSVHARIADRLARAGLPLYAQHVDPIDTGTLVDIFRDDPRASLLGTDALRDGVDVPGDSLRLVIMEGVPWPKPTVLHSARRLAAGGPTYDDMLIRAKLAQAFGRLIRRQGDRGQFILLSAAVPSRLLTAFPEGTPIRRVTLDEAVRHVIAAQSHHTPFHEQDKSGKALGIDDELPRFPPGDVNSPGK